MFKNILLISFFLLIIGCHNNAQKNLVLFDFESDSELDHLHWKCHTLLSLSDERPTHGVKSLRLELYPSAYPGLTPVLKNHDWRGYKSLCFDIYNPERKNLKITVRIDDKEDPDYADRFNHGFTLISGLNRINIPLNDLITSGTNRKLDLNNIQGLVIFMVSPTEKVVLFVDYIRLII